MKPMSDCCSSSKPQIFRSSCPLCKHECKSVTLATVQHHLPYPLNTQLNTSHYYYCSAPECTIGYFSDNDHLIYYKQLRDGEGGKQHWLCYCFGISREQFLQELASLSGSQAKAFVIEQTRAGHCSCETRNPSGQCCLAEFKHLESNHKLSNNRS